MSLPVDKKVIVESKFLAFLFWLVISIALAAGFVGIVVFLKDIDILILECAIF